jgi:prepilin-type N-terminal cleavage/methylation domain-containing protein
MKASAFTLLELLVALAVLVAVSGLALPSLLGRLEGSRLDSALSQFGASVVMLRAQAQERGLALELLTTLRDGAEELGARTLDHATAEETRGESAPIRNVATLPIGLELSTENPMAPARMSEEPNTSSALPRASQALAEARRLAVFMPDGTVIASGPVYLKVADRVFELVFNTWTGGVRSREIHQETEATEEIEPPAEEGRVAEATP